MRNVSGDLGGVLPWLLIRQDGHGNRYRVGSYATRVEAQQTVERLRGGARAGGDGGDTPPAHGDRTAAAECYLVVRGDAESGPVRS